MTDEAGQSSTNVTVTGGILERGAAWIMLQPPATAMLAALLACGVYGVYWGLPEMINRIEAGYQKLAEQHQKQVDQLDLRHITQVKELDERHAAERKELWEESRASRRELSEALTKINNKLEGK